MSEANEHGESGSGPIDGSTALRRLTEAVDHFLWFSGYTELAGKITDAVFYHEGGGGTCNMGTQTFDRLAKALREWGDPTVDLREAKPKQPKRRVVFEFDERSYMTLEQVKAQTGCEFKAVTVKNPDTGETRELMIPVLP